jgi:hypothetical protein
MDWAEVAYDVVVLIQPLGDLCGILYCLFLICFRWEQVRRKYGSLDLLFWQNYVMSVFSIGSSIVALAAWVVLDQIAAD